MREEGRDGNATGGGQGETGMVLQRWGWGGRVLGEVCFFGCGLESGEAWGAHGRMRGLQGDMVGRRRWDWWSNVAAAEFIVMFNITVWKFEDGVVW